MTDEVAIVDRVQVDVVDLKNFEDFAAIAAAEPLEAVYQHNTTGEHRRTPVHGFTADRDALVMEESIGRLIRATAAARTSEKFAGVRPPRTTAGATDLRGPFTPAPPG